MKTFFANIILLVVLRKYEKVLSSSDFPVNTSISTNFNELEYCAVCLDVPMKDIFKTECCKKKFHFECLNDWSKANNNNKVCPLCNGNFMGKCIICNRDYEHNSKEVVTELKCCKTKVHKECIDNILLNISIACPQCETELKSDYDRTKLKACSICKYLREINNDEIVTMTCCGINLCTTCIKYKIGIMCSCNKYLVRGIPSEPKRRCVDCNKEIGIKQFSPRCPHIYCKTCFKLSLKNFGTRCFYCKEIYLKKNFFCMG